MGALRRAYVGLLSALAFTLVSCGGDETSEAPEAEVPGEDVASSPDGQGFLVANSMTIPDGMSPADWSAELLRLTRSGRGPGCEEAIDKDVLAGERATLAEHRCEGTNVIGRSLMHAGRGYYFTIGFPADDSAARATLERIVASVRFLER